MRNRSLSSVLHKTSRLAIFLKLLIIIDFKWYIVWKYEPEDLCHLDYDPENACNTLETTGEWWVTKVRRESLLK